jgi:hypothetical protein
MNRAALIALVQNLKDRGLTSAVEKLLAVVLTFMDTEPKEQELKPCRCGSNDVTCMGFSDGVHPSHTWALPLTFMGFIL